MMFSIICLTYKRPELLEEAVYSVINQTCQDWELLIINDCDFQTIHYDHSQIRIFNIKEKFKSIADKKNFGLDNTVGDWILHLDDDDFLLPFYLENLKKYVGPSKWFSSQRPIMYHDDATKICLSPVPQTNTFLLSKEVAKQFHYTCTDNNDEGITLNSFYGRTEKEFKGTHRYMQLAPEQCGHVWRQGIDARRKYSLADFLQKNISVDKQSEFFQTLEYQQGDIFLSPKWSKDYTVIIKNNMKIIHPMYVYSKINGGEKLLNVVEDTVKLYQAKGIIGINEVVKTEIDKPENAWQLVKPTWSNAAKFLKAIRSRGIVSTALDIVGIDNTMGERVSDDILNQRKLSCFGNDNIKACSRLVHVENKGYFCGSCGCGNTDLARLDSDSPNEYSKLYYPQLECPLKMKGFSNEEIPLSVIIPVLNDNEELNLTIKSIRDTSPSNIEIIVIDDKSDVPVIINDKTIKLTRLEIRQGVGATRHLGATMATSDYLLFVDSHMRFESNWYNNVIQRLINNPSNVVWCGTCLGLDEDNMDVNNPRGSYYGARLSLYEAKENQIFEGKWIPEKEGDNYDLSCMMGACYFFHKSWFFHIGGTKSLKMWGSDEPLLSAKTLLAGGSIKIMKNVKIGHKFRSTASYTTNISYLIYNKLRSIKMLFSNELYEQLKSKLPIDINTKIAIEMLEKDTEEIEAERQYYKTIFIKDEKWLCEIIQSEVI